MSESAKMKMFSLVIVLRRRQYEIPRKYLGDRFQGRLNIIVHQRTFLPKRARQ